VGDVFPSIRLAAVQAAPVLLDRDATVEKACRLIAEAGANGADVVGFPEGFIPAHPVWFHFHPATSAASMAFSKELFANAVVVGGPATDRLCDAARSANVHVVIGICEKEPSSMGTMYNSLLVISRTGDLIGVRRKIVPTVGERIVHSAGAGDSVRVFPTEFGSISGLMCGENSNPLLTYSMSALGAKVHVAAWPSFFNPGSPTGRVDMQAIADVAARAIAYQNSAFVISSIGAVSDEMQERLPVTDHDREHLTDVAGKGGTAVYAPGGRPLAGPLPGGEAIAYADADLNVIVPRTIVHDHAGDYNRFDIFQLVVNVSPGGPPIRLGAAGLNAGDARLPAGAPVASTTLSDGQRLLIGGPSADGDGEAPVSAAAVDAGGPST
jgi:nitrilase